MSLHRHCLSDACLSLLASTRFRVGQAVARGFSLKTCGLFAAVAAEGVGPEDVVDVLADELDRTVAEQREAAAIVRAGHVSWTEAAAGGPVHPVDLIGLRIVDPPLQDVAFGVGGGNLSVVDAHAGVDLAVGTT